MQDLSKITIKSLIGKKVLFILVAIFILLTVGLSEIFIHDQMFEKFVNFTREHEDWDLDEYILVFISIMIALSISLFIASTILIKKLTALTKAHIEQEQNLAHSRKLQSMGTLLGGLAHSLNNHLVPIQTISKILQEDNERLPKCKISDTADSKAVYGVFMDWDNDPDDDVNDMYVASIGAFVVRVHSGETVAIGDYLQSKGDGTAKVQADDILRASTIAKVTSTEKTHIYDDGSYCVPCTLHCG